MQAGEAPGAASLIENHLRTCALSILLLLLLLLLVLLLLLHLLLCSTSGQLAAADGRTNLQEDRSKPLVRSSSAGRT